MLRIDDIHAFGVIGMRECEDFRPFRVCGQIRTATQVAELLKNTLSSKIIYKAIDATAFWTDPNYRKPNIALLKTKKKPSSWLLFYIIKINTFFICVVVFSNFICYN